MEIDLVWVDYGPPSLVFSVTDSLFAVSVLAKNALLSRLLKLILAYLVPLSYFLAVVGRIPHPVSVPLSAPPVLFLPGELVIPAADVLACDGFS